MDYIYIGGSKLDNNNEMDFMDKIDIKSKELKNINFNECEYIGHGRNGVVYQMPNGRVIKICKDAFHCRNEYNVLRRVSDSEIFPKIYQHGRKYLIREYINGDCIKDYIKKNGLSERLARNIVNMLEEFIKYNFTRLDIRGAHIYVIKDERIKVIDTDRSYIKRVRYPKKLFEDLMDLRVYDDFMKVLEKERPDLYKKWNALNYK